MKLELLLIVLTSALAIPAQGTVIISEVFYDTPGTDSKEEWIELYNPSSEPVDIGRYTIEDNNSTYIISSYTMAPGGTIVCARDSSGFYNLYGFYPDFGNLNLSLANDGDYLILKDANGAQIDSVAWEGESGWNIEANEGKSIQRRSLAQGPDAWLSNRDPNPGDPSPIPEPVSLLLLGLGLVGLGWYRRRAL